MTEQEKQEGTINAAEQWLKMVAVDEDDDDVCHDCGNEYERRYGAEPSVLCDQCAQTYVADMIGILPRLLAHIKELEQRINTLEPG